MATDDRAICDKPRPCVGGRGGRAQWQGIGIKIYESVAKNCKLQILKKISKGVETELTIQIGYKVIY